MSTPRPLPDDIEHAMPRGSRVPWEHRLLRLIEPSRTKLLPSEADPEEPAEPEEPEAREPTTVAEAEETVSAAHTSEEYEAAVETLAKLRSGGHAAGEPARTLPAETPAPTKRTRSVLVKEVIGRDEAGRIAKTKEYEVTEPLPEPPPAGQEPMN